jgi:hypothetical protein
VALVGVVAGFFTMLHFAGNASSGPTKRNPIERHPIVRVVISGGGPGRRRGTRIPWIARAYDDQGWLRSKVEDLDRGYVDRKIAEWWPDATVEVVP